MLPRHLSQGICSLIQDETRAAISFMVLLSAAAEVLKVRIFPSIIKVKRRLTYEEVDRMVETDPEIRTTRYAAPQTSDATPEKRCSPSAISRC